MNPLIFIVFLHLLFGLWCSYQVYLHQDYSIFPKYLIKICLFLYFVLLFLSSQANLFVFILSIYLPLLMYIFIEWVILYRQSLAFRSYFLHLIDTLIARIKMGNSFRKSLNLSILSLPAPYPQNIFKEIQNRIIYSQKLPKSSSENVHFTFETLKKTDQDLQPLLRLHYLRQALRIEDDFRKKSRKALLQVHLQSFIMSGIFLTLFILTFLYYGTEFLSVALFASFLFFLGTGIVFMVGRKIKWTL